MVREFLSNKKLYELARDDGLTFNLFVHCHTAFASKPAPTRGSAFGRGFVGEQKLWERACSRKRRISQHESWMYLRLREQARPHI